MIIREALSGDIPAIQYVRNNVRENRLSDPSRVPDKDVEDYLFRRGKGWVCEIDNQVRAFAIVSLLDHNVWALFVQTGFEGRGIGKKLHDRMMDWYFEQTQESIWLSTAPGTRAESFYKKAKWRETGVYGKGEIKFEMSAPEWKAAE